MERDSSRHKVFGRRAAVLGGIKLSLAAVLVGRMYYLQVVESEQYQMLAEENRINMRLLSPPRGLLLDRFGRKVAHNRQNYRVVMVAEQTSDIEATIDRLATVVPINARQRNKVLRDIRRRRPFVPVTVAENLTWEQFSKLNVVLPDLAGVQPDVGASRFYEYGASLAHVVGYVSAVSEKELTGDPLLELPGFRVGKNGVEKVFDEGLRGRAGNQRIEVNAYGRVIRELARQDGEAGVDIVLTIDAELQQAISQRLADESAAAVVMDIHTGELLSLISTPAYDPNAFSIGLTPKAWRELVQHERAPLTNKSISGQYPPGSTFKMLVALAGLEAGVVTPGQRNFCNGRMKLGNATFHCWRHRYGGHGWVDMKQGIAQSCDIYFYELARKVGIDRIGEMAQRFGLGHKLGIELPSERSGLVPTPDWKMAVIGRPWQLGETLITGIGQAYLLSTPLQLATMTARIANGGFAVKPRVIRRQTGLASATANTENLPPERPAAMGISRAHLDVVVDAMSEVVNGKRGTARASRLDEELGVQMAGKTGTAQVRRITKAERQAGGKQAEDTPWKYRDHALFVSFAPVDEPRYAVAVVIEHGRSGTYAAKVTKDVMTEVLRRDPLKQPAVGSLGGSSRPIREG
jgi:penicillin-binding protein 2